MDDVAMEGRGLYDDDYRLGAADDVADEGRGQYDPADDVADEGRGLYGQEYRPGAAGYVTIEGRGLYGEEYRPGAAGYVAIEGRGLYGEEYRPGAADYVAIEGRGLYGEEYRPGAADYVAIEGRGQVPPTAPAPQAPPFTPTFTPTRPDPRTPTVTPTGMSFRGTPPATPIKTLVPGTTPATPTTTPVLQIPPITPTRPGPRTPPITPTRPEPRTPPFTPTVPDVPARPPLIPPINPPGQRRRWRAGGSLSLDGDEFKSERSYPAEVAHTVVARVYTDVDSGEQEAVLMEGLGDIVVTARQSKPAKSKTIRGRNADFEVGRNGAVEVKAVDQRGPHNVIEAGTERRLVDTTRGSIKALAAEARETAPLVGGQQSGLPSTSRSKWIPPNLRPQVSKSKTGKPQRAKSSLARVGRRKHGPR